MEENIDIRVEWRPWQLLESSGGKMSDHDLYSAASSVMNYNRFFSFDGGVSCWSTELLNDNKSKQLMYWGCIFGTVFRWATMCSSIVPWFSCSWMNKQPTAVTSCGKMSELLPKSIIWVYYNVTHCHTIFSTIGVILKVWARILIGFWWYSIQQGHLNIWGERWEKSSIRQVAQKPTVIVLLNGQKWLKHIWNVNNNP